jgi:TolA-binding protein
MAMPDASLIVNTVVTLGVSGTAAALVSAIVGRRKVSAEAEAASATAAQTITATATGLLDPLRAEVRRLQERITDLEAEHVRMEDEQGRMEDEQRLHRRLLRDHADWDARAATALASAGIVLDTPPPLYPEAA